MESFGLLLVNARILVRLVPYLIKLIQLEFPMTSRFIEVHVKLLDGPKRFVLQFHGKMARLAIDKSKGGHPNGGFVRRTIRPKCII